MALLGGYRALARLAAAALSAAAMMGTALAQQDLYDANQVKAAFLYHFGTYVQWPAGAPADDAITIAVLGDDEVAAQLAQFLPGRRIQEQNPRLTQVIAAVAGRPTLVVTDDDNGLDRGAMVNFQLVDSRVRFEISVPRAEEAGLTLSSRLLSAALRVETSECCRLVEPLDGFALHPVVVAAPDPG